MHGFKSRLKVFLIIFCALMILGTLGFMAIEGRSLVDSFYYVIVTIATVGYGDVHPVTIPGKIFTIALIVMGVGTFLGVIGNITELMLAKREFETRMEKLNMVIGVFYSDYPFLFSLALRTNPFDPAASVVIADLQMPDRGP